MNRSFYVACPLGKVAIAREVARQLEENGYIVVSHWHKYDHENSKGPSIIKAFHENYDDLDRADSVFVITFEDAGRETYVEIGRALRDNKQVFWMTYGGASLSLLVHPLVTQCASVSHMVSNL